MYGHSRMTIDPRIPTVPPGFHLSDGHCLRQARSAVRCSASRMKGGWGGVGKGGVLVVCMAEVV